MAKVEFDLSSLKNYASEIEKDLNNRKNKFLDEAILLLGSEFIQRVQDKTPVGEYDSYIEFTTNPTNKTKEVNFKTRDGKNVFFIAKNPPKAVKFKNPVAGKQGGTLRDGWNLKDKIKTSNSLEIKVFNPVDYGEAVENGHRLMNKKGGKVKGFVKGVHMMKNTEIEMTFETPELLKEAYDEFLKDVLK